MYSNLLESLADAEKIREDIETLYWDKKWLKSLIAARISSGIPVELSKEYNTDEEKLSLVFEKLPEKFRNRNDESEEITTLDYIIEHTLYRPREVIELCNLAHEEYIRSSHLHKSERISINIIKEVEEKFSAARLIDFCKEYQYEYPNLIDYLKSFENEKEYYNKKEFLEKLENLILSSPRSLDGVRWIKELEFDAEKLFKILFEIGFIKFFIPNKNQYLACYQTNILDFSKVEKIKINDIFCPALKCC